jgi:exosome complex exonuclease DIS3/RRP44
MVEEFMLLANVAVAEAVVAAYPGCSLLRRHQTPEPRMFEPLLRAGAAAGLAIDASTSKALAASLDLAVRADDAYFNKLVRIMATRCMTQAAYFGSGDVPPPGYHHYGLAAPIYTHFTSPIRRYADVVVHRLLAALIGVDPLPEAARDRAALRASADNLNARHRNAQMAGRASVELHTLIFFKGRDALADARVIKVRANGLVVFVPRYGIEGAVYLTSKDGAAAGGGGGGGGGAAQQQQQQQQQPAVAFVLDEERQTVAAADGSLRYAVFDKVGVRIRVEEGAGRRRQLVLALVPRSTLPPSELMD